MTSASEPPPDKPASVFDVETVPPAAPPCESLTVPPGPATPALDTANGLSIPGYDILATLGRGGMGVVYQARQIKLGRVVALKMILAGAHAGEAELARFRTEAEAIARLQHPNIVQIYEIGEQAGLPYIALEFCSGGSLEKKLSGTPLPAGEAAALVEALARVMSVAHQKGVIHRDLKPANVLFAEDGTPKITDFGLAKKLDDASGRTHTGAILGTPSYMAPEQAAGKARETGPLADVYALGAILYETLTGRPPFRGATMLETLEQVCGQEPVPPSRLQPKLSGDVETICLKCLAKVPGKRYASAGNLAEDLRRSLDGLPIRARPVSMPERLWRWCKRNPHVALLSGLFALGLLCWSVTASLLAVSLKHQKDRTNEARILADENADRAKKNAQAAQENAVIAKDRHLAVVFRMVALGEKLLKRVDTRRFGPNAVPEMRGVRGDLVHVLRESMVQLGKDIEGLSDTGTASAYQILGDMLRKIGLGEEALQQYRQSYDLIRQFAADKPDSDKAQMNKTFMLRLLGDTALELNGDVEMARKHYQEAYDITRGRFEQPRSDDYTVTDMRRLFWSVVFGLGQIELAAGDLTAAGRHFKEELATSRLWLESCKGGHTSGAESSLAGDYLFLGVLADHAGSADEAKKNFDESMRITAALVKQYPHFLSYVADLADSYALLGDFQVRAGQLGEAAATYRKVRENLAIVLKQNPDDTSRQADLARTHEREAALALRQNKPEEAGKGHQEALKIWDELAQLNPNNLTWRAAFATALARAGKGAQAEKIADELVRRCPHGGALLVQAARCYAICAGASADASQKQRLTKASLGALGQVAAAGYKDARLVETDPELAAIRNEPAYQEIVAKLRKNTP
jgi:serine/threonine-protein kinase